MEEKDKAMSAETAPKSEMSSGMSIEETLKELENIIEKMEDRSSTLEETFSYYETGMKMVKACSEKIDKVEKQIQVLSEDGQDGEF